jgi:Domain of unknown function (DUF4159)
MRLPLAAAALAAASVLSAVDIGQPNVRYENKPYNGRYTFIRVRFEPTRWGPGNYMWGLDLKWNHDYPRAESHFTKILEELTTLDVNTGGGNILDLDDPELFNYPLAYLCEVGFWRPTDDEARNLRNYLQKGGFLIVDDFAGPQWANFEAAMQRVLPGVQLVKLDPSHPVFDSFFRVDVATFHHPYYRGFPATVLGVFEDNDPRKRLMVVVNYNQDLSEYWEWSDTGWVPIDLTNEAYKFGVDYVIYGMTH